MASKKMQEDKKISLNSCNHRDVGCETYSQIQEKQDTGASRHSVEKCLETSKRLNHLKWQDYFMGVASLSAMRSKDPNTQVGACIINEENKIVGIGYNGMPKGCSDDVFPWLKNGVNPFDTKYLYVCHAEVNAILNKNSADVKDCTMYSTLFPCNECAKVIIQSGIKTIFYLHQKDMNVSYQAAMRMFDAAGVKYLRYEPSVDQIVVTMVKKPEAQ